MIWNNFWGSGSEKPSRGRHARSSSGAANPTLTSETSHITGHSRCWEQPLEDPQGVFCTNTYKHEGEHLDELTKRRWVVSYPPPEKSWSKPLTAEECAQETSFIPVQPGPVDDVPFMVPQPSPELQAEIFGGSEPSIAAQHEHHPAESSPTLFEGADPLSIRYTAHAKDKPCAMYLDHGSARPSVTQGHHINPMYLQRRLWGAVKLHDRVYLCGSCHDNLHAWLGYLLDERSEPVPNPPHRAREWANEALVWFLDECEKAGIFEDYAPTKETQK